MKRQRGSTLIIYAVLALAVLAALGGIYVAGRNAGQDSKQAEWDEANRVAQAKADEERRQREAIGREGAKRLQSAEARAAEADARWRSERARSGTLATCGAPEPSPSVAVAPGPANAPDGGMRLRLTAEFVRLWDDAWTGQDGQPVFRDPAGSPATAVAAYTAGPGEVLDNHKANAERCSATSRQLNSLIDVIEKLRAGK